MAIVGVGTDIVEIKRIEESFRKFGDKFVQRILSVAEQQSRSFSVQPVSYLAKRFAAKEAIMKALGTGLATGVRFDNFSVLNDDHGKPYVLVEGKAQELMTSIGARHLHISIADEKNQAVAFAIAEE